MFAKEQDIGNDVCRDCSALKNNKENLNSTYTQPVITDKYTPKFHFGENLG